LPSAQTKIKAEDVKIDKNVTSGYEAMLETVTAEGSIAYVKE